MSFVFACLADEDPDSMDIEQPNENDPTRVCEEGVPFEAEVVSFETGQVLDQQINLETLDGTLVGQLPPNGRLFFCVDESAPTPIVLQTPGGQKRLHTIVPSIAEAQFGSENLFQIEIPQFSTLPTEFLDIGINQEVTRSITKIELRSYPAATPIINAEVFSQNINAGSFVFSNGVFVPSTTTDENGEIWFANIDNPNNEIDVEVSSSGCNLAIRLASESGAFSSILSGCF